MSNVRAALSGRTRELERLAVELYARGLSTRDIEDAFTDLPRCRRASAMGLSGHCVCEGRQSPAERRTRSRLVRVPALFPRSRSTFRTRELRRANSMFIVADSF